MTDRLYCSELAQAAGAPLFGTALRVDMWILIEYPQPFRSQALTDNALDPAVNAAIAALPERVLAHDGGLARVQFVRHGGTLEAGGPRLLVADVRDPAAGVRSRTLTGYQQLIDLDVAFPDLEPLAAPQLLVCTNGQRDRCCARFGLPLYEALRAEFGAQVWQTTHVGGHRYAPNLVSLPDGAMYGFVTPEIGPELVRNHAAGMLTLDHLRGFSGDTPAAQAAAHYLRRHLGEAAANALQVLSTTTVDNHTEVSIQASRAARWHIRLQRIAGPPAVTSCETDPRPTEHFHLVALDHT